ncbi:DUF2339 domain-containing protein [Bacteroidota bacterium]
MTENQDSLNNLSKKLETLLKRQDIFLEEVNALKAEINQLKQAEIKQPSEKKETIEDKPSYQSGNASQPVMASQPGTASKKLYRDVNHRILGGVCSGIAEYLGLNRILIRFLWLLFSFFFGIGFLAYIILWIAIPKIKKTSTVQKPSPISTEKPPVEKKQVLEEKAVIFNTPAKNQKSKINFDWEKFIGENLINKIGIAILIIGVGIGAKFSIENDLISPLTRIILGYLIGLGLLGVGMKLKAKFANFSAVLVSGAMAILYFMTYVAYSLYDLFPQTVTFLLMVLFTVFIIIAALNYNKQIIAHIGLVGAYAVPFLLGDDAENIAVLFSYMSIINGGILVLAFKKYWKGLYFSSFVLTWLIFASWYASEYQTEEHFVVALCFLSLFFIIFYGTFLAFKLQQKEKFEITDILLLLANSFIFYGIGYGILARHETGSQFLGVFTIFNGILHFAVSAYIYKQKLNDKNLLYFISGLVLVFITIAIPVQLDGNWVTLLWVGEAALLFWIGRTKQIPVYENISYPLMLLAVISIFQDWSTAYNFNMFYTGGTKMTPLLNVNFLSSLLFIAAFSYITVLNSNKKYVSSLITKKELQQLVSFLIPAVLLSTIYFAFRLEIGNYFDQLFANSKLTMNDYEEFYNYDLRNFKTIWIINYSLLFLSVLSFVNIKKFKNRQLGLINLALSTFAISIFLTQGLYVLSELRESYLEQSLSAYYQIGAFNVAIRYISFAFVAITLISSYTYIRKEFMKVNFKMAFDLLFHISILWIVTSELINLMDLSGSSQTYKLGISILWGIYSLMLIALGIWKHKKYLRIGAIALFSITLMKLFFYDISQLDTISKTIVFLSLGILLLIISFLYNKFKHIISD